MLHVIHVRASKQPLNLFSFPSGRALQIGRREVVFLPTRDTI